MHFSVSSHLESQNEKCDFFETFRKWSPCCVESIRAHKCGNYCLSQARRTLRTWEKTCYLHDICANTSLDLPAQVWFLITLVRCISKKPCGRCLLYIKTSLKHTIVGSKHHSAKNDTYVPDDSLKNHVAKSSNFKIFSTLTQKFFFPKSQTFSKISKYIWKQRQVTTKAMFIVFWRFHTHFSMFLWKSATNVIYLFWNAPSNFREWKFRKKTIHFLCNSKFI